jgi:plastocyanin
VSFECRIDGGPFSACTAPKAYSGLAVGSHTFEVRALDAVGNPSPAASYTWTVGSCSQVSISNFVFTPGSATITAGCTVTWTQTSATKHTTTSDTGVWDSGQLSQDQTFAYQFDTPGTYPYKCLNHPSSMTGTITVDPLTGDTTPPTAAMTFPASGSSLNDAGWDAGCGSGTGDFCGTASDGSGSGVNRVQVSIQQGSGNYWSGSSFGSATEVFFDAAGTTSWSYAFAATNFPTEGPYTIRARSIDDENNVSTVASTTFTIDRTAPPPPTITDSPPNPTTSTSASFSFTDTEPGVFFECRIDGGAFSACTSPKSYSGLAVGSHTFDVRALDAVGNPSTAASYTWTVEACSQVSISNFVFTPASVSIVAGCTVTWTQTSATKHTTTSDTGVWDSGQLNGGQTFTFEFTTPGTYPYKCTNHPSSMTGTITVT